jgi:hypothetical protein
VRRFTSRLARLEAANAPAPCPGPTIRVLIQGRDFPPGGKPVKREVCDLCGGIAHPPANGGVRDIILSWPRGRHEGPLSTVEE